MHQAEQAQLRTAATYEMTVGWKAPSPQRPPEWFEYRQPDIVREAARIYATQSASAPLESVSPVALVIMLARAERDYARMVADGASTMTIKQGCCGDVKCPFFQWQIAALAAVRRLAHAEDEIAREAKKKKKA